MAVSPRGGWGSHIEAIHESKWGPDVRLLWEEARDEWVDAKGDVECIRAIREGDIVHSYDGVHRLVEMEKSVGDCLRMILHKFPYVKKGINFDLPEVVARAPSIPGVTHVGGNMLKSIPQADAIFMKWILTTWTGDECKKIMENCNKSLPEGGKLIASELVLPKETDESHRTRALLKEDIFFMATYMVKESCKGPKKNFGNLLFVSFINFLAIYIDYFYTVLEFQK